MKRILFVVTYFDTGGICRSLQNLLSKIDYDEYCVDVFAIAHQGAFKDKFPHCHLLPKDYMMNALISIWGKATGIGKVVCGIVKLLNKLSKGKLSAYIFRKAAKKLLKNKAYYAVVAYSEGVPTKLVSLMEHSNKVAWIHCDYQSYNNLIGNCDESSIYESFKSIVNVSRFTNMSFLKIYPQFADKTQIIYNILDEEMMRAKAAIRCQYSFNHDLFNIVSVGRLDPVKRLSLIPVLASEIIEAGCRINWYVVGPKGGRNDEYNKLVEGIEKHNLRGVVIITGEQENPYPYIKNADLLVNTSISEACPYVLNEAKILHTPVVCTDFGSAGEFITNGVDGFSVSIDNMAELLIELIQNKEELDVLRDGLEHFHYDNESIVNNFNKLMI